MSKQETLQELIEPVVNGLGCELWGLEYRPFGQTALLRLYIDKPEGITLEDCSEISHQVSGVLEVEDPIGVAYTLEVSSPGVDRPLLKPEHFVKYQNRTISIRCKWPVNERRKFEGKILSSTDLELVLVDNEEEVNIPFDAISTAKLIDALEFKDRSPMQ